MSLTLIRPYFRDRLNAVGLTEWDDAFNFENIPETLLDGAYHIDATEIRNVSIHQNTLQTECSTVVRTFIKGYRTPKDALDNAMQRIEDIYREVLDPANRVTQLQGFKNVLLNSTNIEPLNGENDNAVLITISFTCMVFMDVC